MKLKPEQLLHSLQSKKYSVYWITGDEPLLVQESADAARSYFRHDGFEDREIFNVDSEFSWEQFKASSNNLSLFSTKKVLDLRLNNLKLDQGGKAAIDNFIANNNPEFALLITSLKLDKTVLNSKWLKAHEAALALVQVWPMDRNGLVKWLSQRLNTSGIDADREALQILSQKVEGNLLAAMQEIEKLKLLINLKEGSRVSLNAKTIMQVTSDNSRFDAYDLVDAALLGDSQRCQKIIVNLRAEGVYPLLPLNAIIRELRSLSIMIGKKEVGQGLNSILQTSRVWFSRKKAVMNALQRLSSQDIWRMLHRAMEVDKAIKGASLSNPWDEISTLTLDLSGHHIFQ